MQDTLTSENVKGKMKGYFNYILKRFIKAPEPDDLRLDPKIQEPENEAWLREYLFRANPYGDATEEDRIAFPVVITLDTLKTMAFSTTVLSFQSGRLANWCFDNGLDFFIERDPEEVGIGYLLRFRNETEATAFKVRWL